MCASRNSTCFACCRWLHGLIDTYAEPNPDKAEVHLPIGMKSDVHNMYMEEVRCGSGDLPAVNSNYFNFVWRVRVPHLKVRVFHRLALCTLKHKRFVVVLHYNCCDLLCTGSQFARNAPRLMTSCTKQPATVNEEFGFEQRKCTGSM